MTVNKMLVVHVNSLLAVYLEEQHHIVYFEGLTKPLPLTFCD